MDLLAWLKPRSLSSPYFLNRFVSFCANLTLLSLGIQLHTTVVKLGFCSNVYICSALVDMYGKCGSITCAQKVFDEIANRNVITWNSLISGYLKVQCPVVAIDLFMNMLKVGIVPTPSSISAVLVACSHMEAGKLVTQIHSLGIKMGYGYGEVIGTVLIDTYSKYCNFEDSRKIFDQMPDKNVVAWTSMVTAYAQNNYPDEAMVLVKNMLLSGINPNYITYNSLLSSFRSPDYLDHCKHIHCRIIQEGLESNEYISITLITVYSVCCSSLEDFWEVCAVVKKWDQITWNAVIAGLYNLGDSIKAIECFSSMKHAGVEIDIFTFLSILRAVGIISALKEGQQIHSLIIKAGYASNLSIQNALLSMYARCGALDNTRKIFLSMDRHDVVSWNSMLSGCAYHGYGGEAVELFEKMKKTQIKPDHATLLAVLAACSHVGLLDKGLEYFDSMRNVYSLEPQVEHYATMVDLFGRYGNIYDAEAFIDSMPIKPGPSVYKALLSACQVHGNEEIALCTANKLLKLYPNDPATYVLLSNVLIRGCHWDGAAEARKLMCHRGIMKKPGCSWI